MGAGGGHTASTSAVDPEVSAINRLMRGELERTLPLAGGLPGITAPRPGALPGAAEQDILGRIGGIAQQPVDVPGFLAGNIQRFSPFFAPQAPQVPTIGLPSLRGMGQPAGAPVQPMGVPIPGVRPAADIFQDFSGQLRGAFEQTVAPQVVNFMTASGLGRSGAAGEALAQAGAQFTFPLIQAALQESRAQAAAQQQAQQLQAQFGQQAGLTGAGFAQEAAQAGAGREQAGRLAEFGAGTTAAGQQAQMGLQAALSFLAAQQAGGQQAFQAARDLPIPGAVELERLPTALSALEGPRLAQLQEESRRGDILLQLLQGFPQGTTSTATGRQSANILGPAMSAAGSAGIAAALKCWIAAALYGEGTEKFLLAREWIFERWQSRLAPVVRRLYLRYGPWVATQRWAVRLLKPLFDRAVRLAQAARVTPCPPHEWRDEDGQLRCAKCHEWAGHLNGPQSWGVF